MSPDRRVVTGRRGEEMAAKELVRQGYRILHRNYRCRSGELDLVAMDGDSLVFVEVRRRSSGRYGSALETISYSKQRQIARVANYYLATKQPRFRNCRFDVVGITGEELVVVKDAFRLGELA